MVAGSGEMSGNADGRKWRKREGKKMKVKPKKKKKKKKKKNGNVKGKRTPEEKQQTLSRAVLPPAWEPLAAPNKK